MKNIKKYKVLKVLLPVFLILLSTNIASLSANDDEIIDFGLDFTIDDMGIDGDDPVAPLPDEDDESVTGGVNGSEYFYTPGDFIFNGWIKYTCDSFIEGVYNDEGDFEETFFDEDDNVIAYSNLTNQNVTATLLGLDTGVEVTNNNQSNSYVFYENGEFTFEVKNSDGDTTEFTAVVDFINKTIPTGVITCTEVGDVVIVTISSTSLEGNEITITNNDGSLEYIFTKNGEFTFEYVDAYGNVGSSTVVVDTFIEESQLENYEEDTLVNEDEEEKTLNDDESNENTDENNEGNDNLSFDPTKNELLCISLDFDVSNLLFISFNGDLLDAEYYTLDEENNELHIQSIFLETFESGVYEIEVFTPEGSTTYDIEIIYDEVDSQIDTELEDDVLETPNTADNNTNTYIISLIICSYISLFVMYKTKSSVFK